MSLAALERAAHDAAIARLHLMGEIADVIDEGGEHPRAAELSGDLGCLGCDDCTVREVLDAAWPFLRQLALAEQGALTAVPAGRTPGASNPTQESAMPPVIDKTAPQFDPVLPTRHGLPLRYAKAVVTDHRGGWVVSALIILGLILLAWGLVGLVGLVVALMVALVT